ncbi:MAG: hypothetical protein R8L07_20755 [Alphaproteobacteria bacterium]|nr:hypothetical protein [Alphaproteobacteria bacterium]
MPDSEGILHIERMIEEVEDDGEEKDPLPVRKETGPLMFLSLFLLLLAFFILLNTISTLRETKSRDVLSSVAATFQSDTDPDETAEILVSTLGPVLEPEQVIDEVERLWLTEIPFVKVERVTNGRHIVIELPIIQLFVSGQARVRGDRQDLVKATSYVLSSRIPDQVVIMQAILFVEGLGAVSPTVVSLSNAGDENRTVDPADPDANFGAEPDLNGTELAFARVGVLAQSLIDGGTPPDNLEVGIRKGNEARIRFRFFIRSADAARMTFSDVTRAGGEQ